MNDDKDQLLQQAIAFEENGDTEQAITIYNRIIDIFPDWSIPHYNLGLLYNIRITGDYRLFTIKKPQTYLQMMRLDGNLGIAATALQDWRIARQAWNHFGLNLEITNEEPILNLSRAPVRLDPDNKAEVVWCTRIDPARAIH